MMKFVLYGDPVAQQRCRTFLRGNRMCTFDLQSMFKKNLKNLIQDQIDDYLFDHPGKYEFPKYPRVVFWFLMPIPKSMGKAERIHAESGLLRHVKKPDVDNLIKLYLDVLSGIAIEDDNCVSIGKAVKLYSKTPRTIIFVQETEKLLTKNELNEAA